MRRFALILICFLISTPAWAGWDYLSTWQTDGPNANQIDTDITEFDSNLSSADTDVQKALETLDELSTGGSPGGANTQVQFNDSGSFGGDAGLTFNKGSGVLNLTGSMGINQATPTESLHVTGNTRTSGEFLEGLGSTGTNNTVIGGAFILDPSGDQSITAAGGVTVTNGIMRIQGDGGAVDITANPQIAAGVDGQIVIIQCVSDVNTVKFDDGTGVGLSGGVSFTCGNNDNITFMYDLGETEWFEWGGRNDLN